jgi:hypothetical protein
MGKSGSVDRDFEQLCWNATIEDDLRQVVRLAVREDLDRGQDWTTVALVGPDSKGQGIHGCSAGGRDCRGASGACDCG